MAFPNKTKELAEKCKLCADAGAWFVANGVSEYGDVAILCTKKAEVHVNIVDVMKAADVESH